MAGPNEPIIEIGNWQWRLLDPRSTHAVLGVPLRIVKECGGDPYEVRRRMGYTASNDTAKSYNTD